MPLNDFAGRWSALQFKRRRQLALWLLIAVWFIAVLIGLWWLLDARLVWFDSQGRLQQQMSAPEYEQRLATQLQAISPQLETTVFHVFAENCACNWRTRGHQQVFSRSVTEYGGRNVAVDIDQFPQLKTLIPSTPAVIIFNARQQLVYIGPYADGAFCNSETSFVEQLLPELKSTDDAATGGWINTVARGCYCNVAI